MTEYYVQAALRGFLVVLAISLHAVFEGIAMGLTDNIRWTLHDPTLQPSPRSVWLLFLAISAHKYVISFCISMQFVTSGLPALLRYVFPIFFRISKIIFFTV